MAALSSALNVSGLMDRLGRCDLYTHLIYIHIYTYIYMHINVHTYMHTYIRTHIHAYKHAYKHTYTHTYIHTYIHTYLHVYARIRLTNDRTVRQLQHHHGNLFAGSKRWSRGTESRGWWVCWTLMSKCSKLIKYSKLIWPSNSPPTNHSRNEFGILVE
jgi:hypothetical protein